MTYHSRTPQIDIQTCTKNAGGNKYDLILIAAARAREMAQQNKKKGLHHEDPVPVSALLEVQNGELGIEGLDQVV
jgi:DNA-directed RNA polymerase omega subunit